MKKKTILTQCLSFLLIATLMLSFSSGFIPEVSAARQTDIPQNMWNNSVLRSLEYTGYNLDQQKADGTLYVLYGNDTIKYMPTPNIRYPEDGITCVNGTYTDWVGKGNTGGYKYTSKTGLAPIISHAREHNWVCASYFGYYVYAYLPNIEGVDLGHFLEYRDIYSENKSSVKYWWNTLQLASNDNNSAYSGVSRVYTAPFDDLDAKPTETQVKSFKIGDLIITGGIWEDGTPKAGEERYTHCAIYAGYYGGRHWVVQQSDACSAGPHIYPFDEFMTPTTWKSDSHIVGVYRFSQPPEETYEEGQIAVVKKDPSGNLLAGAEFVITNTATNEQVLLGPTNAQGYAISEKLPFGTYKVEETVFPTGYKAGPVTEWTIKIDETQPQTITLNVVNEPSTGTGKIIKTATNGGSVKGWNFRITNAAGTKIGDYTTGDDGTITVDLMPGTYTVTEISSAPNDYWTLDPTNAKTLTITSGQTSSVTFTNTYQGIGKVIKQTTNGGSKAGWSFQIKDANGSVVASGTTGNDGVLSYKLEPGYYTVTETSTAPNQYWQIDGTPTKSFQVKAGQTTEVTFTNKYFGKAQIIKTSTNGGTVKGWLFVIKKADGTSLGTYTTDDSGYINLTLDPGTYTAQEVKKDDAYWEQDLSVHTFTVTAGQTATVSVQNKWFGKCQIVKSTTNNGSRSGWTFVVKNSAGAEVARQTTGEDGIIALNLAPGTYTVTEVNQDAAYWEKDPEPTKSFTIKAGETKQVDFVNRYKGIVQVTKNTTNNGTKQGWTFVITNAKGDVVATKTTDNTGVFSFNLDPGTYYLKESADSPTISAYWHWDDSKKEFQIIAGETTYVEVTNEWIGKCKIVKTVQNPEFGSVEGWTFTISNVSGGQKTLIDTVKTGKDGTITYDLQPGTYEIKEILEENSLWMCNSPNPQTITVTAGHTISVSFDNELRPGRIELLKTDTAGNPLADAKFLLEYSTDGKTWTAVTFNTNNYPVVGGCTTSGIDESGGILVTGQSGVIAWEGLYPSLYYRVTELAAPNGYLLLKEPAFQGKLPAETLEVQMTVVNSHGYALPATGEAGTLPLVVLGTVITVSSLLCIAVAIFPSPRKKR